MPFETIQGLAGGDIRPSRFVKLSTAADNTFLEADANEATFGIATDATQDAPIPGADLDAAEADDQVSVNPIGSVCNLFIGAGGVTRGADIKSDADGKGVLAATSGTTLQWVGAVALETAIENDIAKVLVVRYPIRPAIV